MPFQEDSQAIENFLTAKFSGTNWDIVRRGINNYMLIELSQNLSGNDFETSLKTKLREQFKVSELLTLRQNINAFLGSYS